jgi:hypothetical protein
MKLDRTCPSQLQSAGFATALLLAASPVPASAAEGPLCGLNKGEPATGAPIEIGAVVSRTGPADVSAGPRASKAYPEGGGYS